MAKDMKPPFLDAVVAVADELVEQYEAAGWTAVKAADRKPSPAAKADDKK